jgi:hypothetical protein
MYGLLLTLVLAQAGAAGQPTQEPSAVVLVERGVGLSPESAQALATEVSMQLEKGRIPVAVAPEQVDQRLSALGEPAVASCEGERPCLLRRARALGATLLVLVRANERTDTLTLNLEALAVEDGASLWKDLFLVTVGNSEELRAGTVAFAQSLRDALPKPAPIARPEPAPGTQPKPGPDAPLATPSAPGTPRLEPSTQPRQDEALTLKPEAPTPSGKRSRTLLYATGGGTIAAVGAAVTFGLMGRGQKSRLDDARFTDASTGREASRLTRPEADRISSRANLYFNVALSSAIVSAVLGTTTGYLWLKDEPAP